LGAATTDLCKDGKNSERQTTRVHESGKISELFESKTIVSWWKHAFAIDLPGASRPDPQHRSAIDGVLREIVRRRMTIPARLMLESMPNMNYLGAQALHFFAPFVAVLGNREGYDAFASFLEQRGSVEYMIHRLDALEGEAKLQTDSSTPAQGLSSQA